MKLRQQWIEFYNSWLQIADDARLSLAGVFADYKHWAGGRKEQYFVLPDERDKLLVLSPSDIERLKKIGKMEYRNVYTRIHHVRKKAGRRVKRKVRIKIIGRKLHGISRMSHKVTTFDVRRECFYCSATGSDRLSSTEAARKRAEWHAYLLAEREYQRNKKARKQPRGLFATIRRIAGM